MLGLQWSKKSTSSGWFAFSIQNIYSTQKVGFTLFVLLVEEIGLTRNAEHIYRHIEVPSGIHDMANVIISIVAVVLPFFGGLRLGS